MFSFAMSKEQKMVKDEFAKFVKEMVIDAAHDMDEDGKIPDDVIQKVGPAGYFMGEPTTVKNLRSGEWYLSDFGWQGSYEDWKNSGMPNVLSQASARVKSTLATHQPIPLNKEIERELEQIYKQAENQ